MEKDNLKNNSGQSLVEMLVALSIVVLVLLGILTLVNRSLGLSRVTSDNYTAAYLAAEGIELVKNLFDRSYLYELRNNPGNNSLYGWSGDVGIAPTGNHGIYKIDYKGTKLIPIIGCNFSGEPTQGAVRTLLTCQSQQNEFLKFNPATGLFSYEQNAGDELSKFKRIIIIDKPKEFQGSTVGVDYRVTSAVGWLSRGGEFTVQLQDHFLPWRLP